MSTAYIDAHCHMDECPDPLAVARECERLGVVVVAVTATPARFRVNAARLFEEPLPEPRLVRPVTQVIRVAAGS